jgi:shikimate dehydrogenase
MGTRPSWTTRAGDRSLGREGFIVMASVVRHSQAQRWLLSRNSRQLDRSDDLSRPALSQVSPDQYEIVTKAQPTFYFIGVTTSKSSIMRVFPLWAAELGHPELAIEGVDCKIHDDPERYRRAVAQIKYDPLSVGALITTHKIDLLSASRDMFDYLDPYAALCGEISSISKSGGHAGTAPTPGGRLEGHAKDPITAGLSLDAVLGEGYFGRTGGHVLCFGAGGSAAAIALHLIMKLDPDDRPARFVAVNRSPGRLAALRAMVERLHTGIVFEYICNANPQLNDAIMARLPEGSLVINATGMGKDTPGSPITDAAPFPLRGVVWELNYRGELDFLHQALAQREARQLRVEDGWSYFLHGWTQVIAQVLHIPLDAGTFDRLATIAAEAR